MKDTLTMLAIIGVILAGLYALGALAVYDYNVCRENGHSIFYCLRSR